MLFLLQRLWDSLLLPIPMPWQAIVVLFLVMPIVPLLVLRLFPWFTVAILQIISIIVEFLVRHLLWFDYLIAGAIRKKKKPIPYTIYFVGDILANLVKTTQFLNEKVKSFSKKIFLISWIIRPKALYVLPIILIPLWFLRPNLGDSSFGKLLDGSFSWWCSLEHWIMIGEWKPSSLTCSYPNKKPRWENISLKSKEYKLKRNIQQFEKKIRTQPNIPDLYYEKGKAYLALENVQAALKAYTASTAVAPSFAPGYVGRGDIYFQKKDYKGAFNEYSKAIRANSNYAPGYVGRGNVYLLINDNSSAFKEYTKSMSINSKYPPTYVGIGNVYQQKGDKEAALQKYKKAINLNPNYALAYFKLGDLWYKNYDNREAAIPEYEKAATIYKKDGQIDSYNDVSIILKELNNYLLYSIKYGDSLGKISQNYGVSMKKIISANKETYPRLVNNPDRIEIGRQLKIPQ
jgi:tetratricopeptide (TPR) repeat protein